MTKFALIAAVLATTLSPLGAFAADDSNAHAPARFHTNAKIDKTVTGSIGPAKAGKNKAAQDPYKNRPPLFASLNQDVIELPANTGRPALAAKTRGNAKLTKTSTARAASLAGGRKFENIVSRYAKEYGVPASLAHAVIHVESNYRVDARGGAGEVGLMQIKPATARMLGFQGNHKALFDPETNIRYGMKYLAMAQDLSDGSTCGTILKYNAGHGARRMNPVSAAYCAKVKRILRNA